MTKSQAKLIAELRDCANWPVSNITCIEAAKQLEQLIKRGKQLKIKARHTIIACGPRTKP